MTDFEWLIPADFTDIIENERGRYIVMGAILDGIPSGVIISGLSFGDDGAYAEIVHLCVAPDFRRRGVGRKLVHELAGGLTEAGGIDKLCCDFPNDEGAIAFFAALDFDIMASEGGVYLTTIGALANISFWNQGANSGTEYIPISDLPAGSLAEFKRRSMNKLGLLMPPFAEKGLLPDMSYVFVSSGRVEGIAAMSESGGVLELSWLYCSSEYIKHLPELLRSVYHKILAEWPEKTPLRIAAVTESSAKLAKKLCPDDDFYPNFVAKINLDLWQIHTLAGQRQAELMAESNSALDWWNASLN
jgi:GNAT superfamily N-acetyltransferase